MQGNWQENHWGSSWLLWRFSLLGLLALGSLFGMGLGFTSLSWSQAEWLSIFENDRVSGNVETAVFPLQLSAIPQTAVLQHTPPQLKHAALPVARTATNVVPLDQINKRVVETAVRLLPPEPLNSAPLFAEMDTAVAAPADNA
ncbi:MAG: hypothetical protein GY943_08455, partial [Chloroflexi bacterium]|nr:hypothetical protein [Chloroflexota bacterium]